MFKQNSDERPKNQYLLSNLWNIVCLCVSVSFRCSLFSDLRSLAGTALLSLLASLFMGQLMFVIGVGGVQVRTHAISEQYIDQHSVGAHSASAR